MSEENHIEEPLQVVIIKPKKNKKLMLLAGILVVVGLGTGGYLVFLKPRGTPAPTIKHVENSIIKAWNKYDLIYSTPNQTINCTYDPTKLVIGYKFTCSIYNGQDIEIGTAQVTTDAPTQGTWNFSTTIGPDNPIQ